MYKHTAAIKVLDVLFIAEEFSKWVLMVRTILQGLNSHSIPTNKVPHLT
jgi:hypothetical protein